MKFTKYAVLTIVLTLVVMSAVGILFAWIFGLITGNPFDNLVYTGVQLGLLSAIVVMVLSFLRTHLGGRK